MSIVPEPSLDQNQPTALPHTALEAELLEALRFYADPANWQDFIARPRGRDSYYHSAHAHLDKGEKARAIIAKAEGRA